MSIKYPTNLLVPVISIKIINISFSNILNLVSNLYGIFSVVSVYSIKFWKKILAIIFTYTLMSVDKYSYCIILSRDISYVLVVIISDLNVINLLMINFLIE